MRSKFLCLIVALTVELLSSEVKAENTISVASDAKSKTNYVCDWKKVPYEAIEDQNSTSYKSDDDFCDDKREVFESTYDRCLSGHKSLETNMDFIGRLKFEQLKLVFNEELASTCRISPELSYHDRVWNDFEKRWKKIGKDDFNLLESIDRDPQKVSIRCELSAKLGIGCGENPETKVFNTYRQGAIFGFRNESASRVIPRGLVYDLIKSELVFRSYHTPIENLLMRGAKDDDVEVQRREIDLERRVSKDTVMGYWPELRTFPTLRENIKFLIRQRGLEKKILDAVVKIELSNRERLPKSGIEFGAPATHSERDLAVDNLMKVEFFKNPVSPEFVDQVERHFIMGHQALLRTINKHILRGRIDSGWLMEQQYLLTTIKEEMIKIKKFDKASQVQTQICHNIYVAKKYENAKKLAMSGATVAAVVTGAGGMTMGILRWGPTAVARYLGETSGGLILASSGFELYDLYEAEQLKKELFAIHQVKDSHVAYAHADTVNAIPMAALNLVLIGPAFLLKTGPLLKWIDYANFGMAGYMAKAGYADAEKIVFETPEKRAAARKRAVERAEIRERIIKERTGVD